MLGTLPAGVEGLDLVEELILGENPLVGGAFHLTLLLVSVWEEGEGLG